jgi:GTP-binding protein
MLPRPAVRSTSGRRACTASALLPASAWRPIHSRRRPPRAHANRSAGPAATDDAPQQLQLKLPSAEFSRIKKAVFVRSSVDLKGCPPEKYPEFAVIGRSNVGKSSLINMLTSSDGLAKVSKEPGEPCQEEGRQQRRLRQHVRPLAHPRCPPARLAAGAAGAHPGCGVGTTGMTKTINHFLINDAWYLVDLPGYG